MAKGSETKPWSFRFSPSLRSAMEAHAAARGIKLTDAIHEAVAMWIVREEDGRRTRTPPPTTGPTG